MRTFHVPAMRFSRLNKKKSLFLFASVRLWQHGGGTNTKQNSINLFMLGYQRFVILFYLYLFTKKGNAPVLSRTPGSCIFVLLTGKHEAM